MITTDFQQERIEIDIDAPCWRQSLSLLCRPSFATDRGEAGSCAGKERKRRKQVALALDSGRQESVATSQCDEEMKPE